jgi:hypothetical protein
MPRKDLAEKSCDSQLFPEGDPTSEWGLDRLGAYAQLQYRQIMDSEKTLTAAYWRLGCGLVLAKRIFKHGCWGQHLKILGIDRTRAAKATAIYKTFAKEEDVAGLRVDEAYARRERKLAKRPAGKCNENSAAKKDAKILRASIGRIAKRTGSVIHIAAFAEPRDAASVIPAVRKVIRQLEDLLHFLEEQAAKAAVNDQGANAVVSPSNITHTSAQ